MTIEGFTLLSHLTTYYDASNNIFNKYVNYNYLSSNYYTQIFKKSLISNNNDSILNYISSIYTTKSYVNSKDLKIYSCISANFYPNNQCDSRYYTKSYISSNY